MPGGKQGSKDITINYLNQQLDEKAEQINELEQKLNESYEQINELLKNNKQVIFYQNLVLEDKKNINYLNQQLDEKAEQINELEQKLNEREKTNNELEQKLNEREKTNNELEQKLNEKVELLKYWDQGIIENDFMKTIGEKFLNVANITQQFFSKWSNISTTEVNEKKEDKININNKSCKRVSNYEFKATKKIKIIENILIQKTNSIDLHNQHSTSGYKPNSPKM